MSPRPTAERAALDTLFANLARRGVSADETAVGQVAASRRTNAAHETGMLSGTETALATADGDRPVALSLARAPVRHCAASVAPDRAAHAAPTTEVNRVFISQERAMTSPRATGASETACARPTVAYLPVIARRDTPRFDTTTGRGREATLLKPSDATNGSARFGERDARKACSSTRQERAHHAEHC